jgi:pimeloyl-ACP methyl ester carboxylesterase
VSRVRGSAYRRGALVINEGGPGPHLADASVFGGLAPRGLLAAYDVASFDQRGFGRSAPVSCGLSPDEQAEIPPWPQRDGAPAGPEQARQVAGKCAARAGGEMPFLGTANVARDIDRILAIRSPVFPVRSQQQSVRAAAGGCSSVAKVMDDLAE